MEKKKEKKDKYTEATGRRKTSTARVRVYSSSKASFLVNGIEASEYFKTQEQKKIIHDPITSGMPAKDSKKLKVEVRVSGGGMHSQAEAIRHGLARALSEMNPEFRPEMKTLGYLKRDPRSKERRKFGLKKARKAPQWSKR